MNDNAAEEKKLIEMGLTKGISIIAGALLVGFVGGAFATIRTIQSNYYTLIALGGRVDAIEESYVPRNEYSALDKRLDRMETQMITIINRLP